MSQVCFSSPEVPSIDFIVRVPSLINFTRLESMMILKRDFLMPGMLRIGRVSVAIRRFVYFSCVLYS
jgi:hypothetical protein